MSAMPSTAKVATACRGCRRLTTKGAFCPTCQKAENRRHFNKQYNDPLYRVRRARAIRDHISLFGYWCPGYGVPGHPSNDLTTDHPIALAKGGDHNQPLVVLCRSCNGRKGARDGS